MDDFIAWAIVYVSAFVAFAFVVTGVVWLVITFWWAFLLVGAVVAAGLVYHRHPGVRAKREIKAAVRRGNQLRGDIHLATEHTIAEMDRIARDWNRY